MIEYCQNTGLVLNNDKTPLLVSTNKDFEVQVGSSFIRASPSINILGVDYDSKFTTTPFLHKLASACKTRAALIRRLSFAMPRKLLSTFAHGRVMGKILAASAATIPVRLQNMDRFQVCITEEINKSIKAVARTIMNVKLSDKVRSETVLWKTGLRCSSLNHGYHCLEIKASYGSSGKTYFSRHALMQKTFKKIL